MAGKKLFLYKFKVASIAILSIMLFGCATDPAIDPKGVDMQVYEMDLAECKIIADKADKAIGKTALFGGVLLGAATALFGGSSEDVAAAATVGAAHGVVSGGLKDDEEGGSIVKKCLTNRGYTILN